MKERRKRRGLGRLGVFVGKEKERFEGVPWVERKVCWTFAFGI